MIFRVDATAGAPMFSWSGQRSRPATPRHFAQALQTLPARRAEILWRNASIPCDFRNPAAAGGSMPDVIAFGLPPTNSGSRAPAPSPDTVLTEVPAVGGRWRRSSPGSNAGYRSRATTSPNRQNPFALSSAAQKSQESRVDKLLMRGMALLRGDRVRCRRRAEGFEQLLLLRPRFGEVLRLDVTEAADLLGYPR
jgi:hypothetical protein